MFKIVYEYEEIVKGVVNSCIYTPKNVEEFETLEEATEEFDKFENAIIIDGQGLTSTKYRTIATLYNDDEQIDTK